ncbi:MAG: DUF342 domain-containing protein [Leptonema sp. (in: bacteria)]
MEEIFLQETEDKLQLYLIYRGVPLPSLHEENIYSLLRQKRVTFGVQKEKIKQVLEILKNPKETYVNVKEVIAKGIAPEESIDGSYQLLISLEPKIPMTPDGKVDHKNIEYYKIVQPKQKLVILKPPYKGKPGINIYGEEIPSKEPKPIPITLGNNMETIPQEDKTLLGISKIYGVLTFKENCLDVSSDLIIEEDASIEKGNLKFNNSIFIKKNVLRGLSIFCGKNLNIEENLESGLIRVMGNLIVKGGIHTANQGTILCKGDVFAEFIENTNLQCEGLIQVKNSILNSNIICHKSILLENPKSILIGGNITFYEFLEVGSLGNESQITTNLYVGYHFNYQKLLETMVDEFKKIEEETLKLSNELKEYNQKVQNKIFIPEKVRTQIPHKIQIFNKYKETYLKKKAVIEHLKKNIFNPNPIEIKIHHTIYAGVVIHYYERKFPIMSTIFKKNIRFDPVEKMIYFQDSNH